jgi:hypothetical protein
MRLISKKGALLYGTRAPEGRLTTGFPGRGRSPRAPTMFWLVFLVLVYAAPLATLLVALLPSRHEREHVLGEFGREAR